MGTMADNAIKRDNGVELPLGPVCKYDAQQLLQI